MELLDYTVTNGFEALLDYDSFVQSGCSILHSCQQYRRTPGFPLLVLKVVNFILHILQLVGKGSGVDAWSLD